MANDDLIPIKLEGATLKTFAPRKGRTNAAGEEIESPKMLLAFLVDVDRVQPLMNRITRIYMQDRAVTLGLDFPEQLRIDDLKVHDDEFSKRPTITDPLGLMPLADKNGHGGDAATAGKKPKREKART